jgi:hypothetical protein
MSPYATDDAILRENRRIELARRLTLHGVRTKIISQLTGLTRNRLATIRRRLMVSSEMRRRGPTRSSLGVFLRTPRARSEGAALAALCTLFEVPSEEQGSTMPRRISLDYGERLCEMYETYCAWFPHTEVALEELILLRRALASGERIRLGKCPNRQCRCPVLVDRYGSNGQCWHCGGDDLAPSFFSASFCQPESQREWE